MKVYGGVDILIHVFLTSELIGGEWSASRPCPFTPGKSTWNPLDRRLGEPQSQSVRYLDTEYCAYSGVLYYILRFSLRIKLSITLGLIGFIGLRIESRGGLL
jgi:hypothetical protein